MPQFGVLGVAALGGILELGLLRQELEDLLLSTFWIRFPRRRNRVEAPADALEYELLLLHSGFLDHLLSLLKLRSLCKHLLDALLDSYLEVPKNGEESLEVAVLGGLLY